MSRRRDIEVDGWVYTHVRPKNRPAAKVARDALQLLGKPALSLLATLATRWAAWSTAPKTMAGTLAAFAEVLSPEQVGEALDLALSKEVEGLVFDVLDACDVRLGDATLRADNWHDAYDDAAEAMEEDPGPAPFGPHMLAMELALRYRLFPLPGGSEKGATGAGRPTGSPSGSRSPSHGIPAPS